MTFKNIKSAEDLAQEKVQADAQTRINELKQLLNESDHKNLPNYKPKQGEDLVAVIAERDAWRNEIRQLKLMLETIDG